MKTHAIGFLLFALAVFFTGCTRVAVVKIVGTPVEDTAILKELTGVWQGAEGATVTVSLDASDNTLTLTSRENEKETTYRARPTRLDAKTQLLWIMDNDTSDYVFCRFVSNKDAIVIFAPDNDEIRRLVAAGELTQIKTKSESDIVLSDEKLEPLLKTKAFWNIESAMAFVRIKTPPASQ